MIDHKRKKEEFHYILRQEAVSLPFDTFLPFHLVVNQRELSVTTITSPINSSGKPVSATAPSSPALQCVPLNSTVLYHA